MQPVADLSPPEPRPQPQPQPQPTTTTTTASMLTRTARGAGWVVGWRMSTRLLGIANTLLLVRLLVPADFGLIALAVGFSQAIDQLSGVGVDEALMRVKSPGREVYDTAFTINMLRGFGTTVILLAGAYPVAVFFNEPRLLQVFFALAVGCFVMSFENIAVADFRRDMAFRKEFQLLIVPRLINIVVAATAAIVLRNYWALVCGMLTTQVLRIGMGYVMHPYRPRLTLRAWHELAGFSAWNWAISVATLVRERVDSFVIGRVLNPTALGIYGVGTEVAVTPTQELTHPLSRACFPTFVAARHSGLGTAEAYFRIISSTALFIFPAALGTSLVAGPVVALAFGKGWDAAIVLVQVIALTGIAQLFGIISATLFHAHGLLRLNFYAGVIATVVRVVLMVTLIDRFGLIGGGVASVLGAVVEHGLYTVTTFRHFRLKFSELFLRIWRGIFATGVMSAVLVATGLGWVAHSATPARDLLLAVPVGGAVYAAVLLGTWLASGRPRGAESDILGLFAQFFPKLGVRLGGLAGLLGSRLGRKLS